MRIIKRSTLKDFSESYPDAEGASKTWFHEVKRANWTKPQDVKEKYRTASIIGNNRVVFNIGGNKYRLIAEINYPKQIVMIRFLGTHEQYDKVNAKEVKQW
ncbi:MAG: type II toxin-antitoxin system HigB family toxin [Thermodesulfobacteriota bacterium]